MSFILFPIDQIQALSKMAGGDFEIVDFSNKILGFSAMPTKCILKNFFIDTFLVSSI
jgi:hypothetical protein